jgi:hypothetical protein
MPLTTAAAPFADSDLPEGRARRRSRRRSSSHTRSQPVTGFAELQQGGVRWRLWLVVLSVVSVLLLFLSGLLYRAMQADPEEFDPMSRGALKHAGERLAPLKEPDTVPVAPVETPVQK